MIPWAVCIVLLAVLGVMGIRWSQVRPILRDMRGDVPLLVIDGKVYAVERNP